MQNDTFRNCTSLTNVTFPTSLNNIPAKAYEGCAAWVAVFHLLELFIGDIKLEDDRQIDADSYVINP